MNKSTKIVLIISIIIVFIGACLIVLSTLNHKKTPTPVVDNNNEFGIYKDENEIRKTLSQSFNLYGKCQTGKDFQLLDGETANINNLSKDNINHIVFMYLESQNLFKKDDKQTKGTYIEVEKSSISKALENLFGKEYANKYIFDNEMNISGGIFTLNNNTYSGTIPIDLCLTGKNIRFYNYRNFFENDTYNVEYALYWFTAYELRPGLAFYAYNSANTTEVTCTESELENNIDKFTRYRFVFIKQDNSFIFDHIELVK